MGMELVQRTEQPPAQHAIEQRGMGASRSMRTRISVSKIFGLILNAIGSDIEAITWREGESLAVGEGNELAKRLEELLKKDVPELDPDEDFDF